MKKLLFLLITLATFTNFSYGSFPITENLQSELIESVDSELPTYKNNNPIWGILSVISAALGVLLIALSNPSSILFFIMAITFGAIGFRHKPKGLAITGFILGLLPFLLATIMIIILLIGILFFDWSFMIM